MKVMVVVSATTKLLKLIPYTSVNVEKSPIQTKGSFGKAI
jgi:hypothetical protein